jgi:PAS domain S-box-containing protein
MFQSLRSSQLQYLEYVAVHIEEKMNMLIAGKEQLLEKIATSEMVTNYTKKQSENMLVGYFDGFMSEFAELSFVNDKGIEEIKLVNGKIAARVLDKTDSVLIEQLKQNPDKTLNAYPTFSPETAGPCIEFGFLNKSFFDEFVGIILGKVSVVELSKNIPESKVGKTGSVILLDSEGTILSCRDRSKILQKIVIEGTEAREAIAGIKAIGSGFGHAKILGLDSYFAYTPVHGQNWVVMTVLPYREFVAALNTLRNTVLLVGFSVLVVGAILSLLLAQNMTGPILKLVKGTSLIAKGDFSHKIHTTSQDEIGTLAKSFNRMAEDLRKTTTSIDNLNREIADRKKAENALKESEQRLSIILNSILTGVVIVDAETHKIVDANPLAIELIGLPKEEIIGKVCHKFICPAEEGKCPISDLNQTVDQSERVLIRGNGKEIPILKTVTPVSWQGHSYLVESFIDITERKQAEQRQAQLIQELERTNQKVENVNQELKDFAYIVSHDLKAPLRGIKTLAEWISTDYADKLDDNGKEQMNLLAGRVDRMHNLTDGILQYSRVGRVEEEKVVVNLNELVTEVIDMIAPPENVTITIENELPTVECEQTRIMQVFQNLLSNAVKYMDKPQGQIKIGCIEENGFWEFYVADNGPGIEEKYFEKIFQLFQTLAPRDESESTGIGLTIIKKIVEMYGGKTWVQSKVGEGSTFFFTLPKALSITDNQEQLLTTSSC